MRTKVPLGLLLLVGMCVTITNGQQGPFAKGIRKPGQGRSKKVNSTNQSSHQRGGPLLHGEQGTAVFLDSYKRIHEQESSYNIIPGRKGQCQYMGISMFDKAVWSPKPCVTCLCTAGSVVCDEVTCPMLPCLLSYTPDGECCPVCIDPVLDLSDFSGESPEPSDPNETNLWLPQTQAAGLDKILGQDLGPHKEHKGNLLNRDERRRRRRKEKREREAEKMRGVKKEQAPPTAERWQSEEANTAEEKRRREQEEEDDKMVWGMETEEKQRLTFKGLEGDTETAAGRKADPQEEEEIVWLRGDVFQMPPLDPEENESPSLPPFTEPAEPTDDEEEEEEEEEGGDGGDSEEQAIQRVTHSLPKGCTVSDVSVTCDNAKLTSIPPLSIPELKSLSLEGK